MHYLINFDIKLFIINFLIQFMSWGFPSNQRRSYSADTSAKKEEFLHNIKLSQKYWGEENYQQSLVKLRIALKIGRFIIQNQSKGPIRDSFVEKLKQLLKRQQQRSNQVKSDKPIQHHQDYTNTSGNRKIKSNEGDDKLKNAINQVIVTQKPHVQWEDISGLQNAKNSLKQAVILPIKFPEIFTGARKPWKGILLYGPPGTGKTFLAKACATESDATFFSVSSSDLMSKYVGESEKLIKQLFNLARQKKPSIIFIDQIDSMCGKRMEGQNEASRRVKTQFFVQMQGVGKDDQGILVLGATNIPWVLDPAIRRRFQRRIYIPLPQQKARYEMLIKNMKNNQNSYKQEDFLYFAKKTEGFSGSDISILVRDTVYQPIRKLQAAKKFRKQPNGKFVACEDNQSGPDIIEQNWMNLPKNKISIPIITVEDMEVALTKTKPSVDKNQLKQYENFTKNYGQDG